MGRRTISAWFSAAASLCLVAFAVSAAHTGRLWPDFDSLAGAVTTILGFPFFPVIYLALFLLGLMDPSQDTIADNLDSLGIPLAAVLMSALLLQWLVLVPWAVRKVQLRLSWDPLPPLWRLAASYAAAFLLYAAAIYLVQDAMTFSLMPDDPLSGRARGCYSALELWAGSRQPTEWGRPAQMSIALLLAPLSLGAFLWLGRSGPKRPSA